VDEQSAEGLTDIFCNPDQEAVALLFGTRQSAAREQREIQFESTYSTNSPDA